MMSRSPRRLLHAWMAAFGMAALLSSAAAGGIGCKQTACFQWSEAEGMCPARGEARDFFGTCNDISAINDDGAYSGNLCCYDVTKSREFGDCVDSPTGFPGVATAVGVGSGTFTSGGSGPPPNTCEFAGECGDTARGCIGCALSGTCSALLNACTSNAECLDVLDCLSNCSQDAGSQDAGSQDAGSQDAACSDACKKARPEGADRYSSMIDCAVCKECPKSCSDMTPSVCFSGSGGAGGADGGKN
jgi:hypothetical protein